MKDIHREKFNLPGYLKEKRGVIDGYLNKILMDCGMKRELIMAMKHSLMAGGKRLRPVLCLAAAEACNQDPAYALPCACAIEMIHTYSLIHDDLPAMDNDDLRRGSPACHIQFSEATAILAGDGLLTHGFQILARPELVFEKFPEKTLLLDLIAIISEAAGTNGMVEGQMMDMQSEFPACADLEYLEKMHRLKTGKMIKASVVSGAVSVKADKKKIDALLIYAEKTGLAFQVTDDILNIEGDPKIMGKAAGSDAMNHKLTFPGLIGLEKSKKYAQELINEAVEALGIFQGKALPLQSIAEYILTRKK